MRDDLDDLPALARTIEPLPGGLHALRRRLREPVRGRRPLAAALAAACCCCAALALWLLRPAPGAADRSALHRLVVDDAALPHPLAVGLGLVASAVPQGATDPRVAPSDTAVFYWAPPAQPVPDPQRGQTALP